MTSRSARPESRKEPSAVSTVPPPSVSRTVPVRFGRLTDRVGFLSLLVRRLRSHGKPAPLPKSSSLQVPSPASCDPHKEKTARTQRQHTRPARVSAPRRTRAATGSRAPINKRVGPVLPPERFRRRGRRAGFSAGKNRARRPCAEDERGEEAGRPGQVEQPPRYAFR